MMQQVSGVSAFTAQELLLSRLQGTVWVDGLDGQEDELEDVQKGKLDPPTETEGEGSIDDRNSSERGLESEDEEDALVERIERGDRDAEETLARRAGIKLPR